MRSRARVAERPHLLKLAPVVLYETLGPSLPDDAAAAAVLWGAANLCAVTYPESVRRAGFADGNALFEAVLRERRGLVSSIDEHEVNWKLIARARPSGRLDLASPELLRELAESQDETDAADPESPFALSAGVRRSNTAQTLMRNDVVTAHGRRATPIEVNDMMRPGNISLPNGFGLANGAGGPITGVPPNELTSSSRRDWLAGTPWHKHVPARLEPVTP